MSNTDSGASRTPFRVTPVRVFGFARNGYSIRPEYAGVLTVFRAFLEHRTLRATVVALRKDGLKIPRKKPGRPLHWADAAIHSLRDMLRHPAYKGEYHYRRHVDDRTKPRSAKGCYRPRRAEAEEIIVVPTTTSRT